MAVPAHQYRYLVFRILGIVQGVNDGTTDEREGFDRSFLRDFQRDYDGQVSRATPGPGSPSNKGLTAPQRVHASSDSIVHRDVHMLQSPVGPDCREGTHNEGIRTLWRRALYIAIAVVFHCCQEDFDTDQPGPDSGLLLDAWLARAITIWVRFVEQDHSQHPPMRTIDQISALTMRLWHRGLVELSCNALCTVRRIYEKVSLPAEDERWSHLHCRLGIVLSSKGVSKRRQSRRHREAALAIRQRACRAHDSLSVMGPDLVRLWNAQSDVAFMCLHEERFEQVESIMQSCLAQYRAWSMNEADIPFEYAKYYFCMSFVRMWKSQTVDAVKSARRAVVLIGQAAGESHLMTQLFKMGLGTILYHAGAVRDAWSVNEDVLRVRMQRSGMTNHNTLESLSTCGALLGRLGQYREASSNLRECLVRAEQGGWYPEGLARTRYRLAKVLPFLDGHEESRMHLAMAYSVRDLAIRNDPDAFHDCEDDEAEFDRMVPIWAGRLTGRRQLPTSESDPRHRKTCLSA